MKKYELIILFADAVKADDQEKVLVKVEKDIKDAEGKLIEKKELGKKDLAYLINKNSRAFYWHLVIELSADKMSAFKRKLTLNTSILRFLLVIQK